MFRAIWSCSLAFLSAKGGHGSLTVTQALIVLMALPWDVISSGETISTRWVSSLTAAAPNASNRQAVSFANNAQVLPANARAYQQLAPPGARPGSPRPRR